MRADQTECSPQSGSGGQIVAARRTRGDAVALALAPLVWNVLAAGFAAGKAALNGTWALDLRHVVGGHCVWDNGGDGVATPRVELRCESPLATTWRLTLRHGSNGAVEYIRSAAEWNPLTSNVLHHTGNGSPAPDFVTATPG